MSKNVYEIVTERIIQELENGTAPWRKPWSSAWSPKNFVSAKPYRGINYALLSSEVGRQECPYFATKKQTFQRGGRIKSGQWKHYSIVTFWKLVVVAGGDDVTGEDDTSRRTIPLLRYYKVWNLQQTEGISWSVPEETHIDPIESCEAVVTDYEDGPEIHANGVDQAYYRSGTDSVHLPCRNAFNSGEAYYGTLFHELIHSTGHKSRLDRGMSGGHHSKAYSREELCAEMGAALLLGSAGIVQDPIMENSGAYLRSWIQNLTEDPKCLAVACSRAQKAADWVLGKREIQQSQELKEAA
jgi:antirestriction protein ArdC